MDNNQRVKIVFWYRYPFQKHKHKKTVVGTIIKDGPHDFVVLVDNKAIVIPHRDVLRIQELTFEGCKSQLPPFKNGGLRRR